MINVPFSLLAFGVGMPGPFEMAIIGAVLLLLFGNRLPSTMRSLGRSVVEFKKGVSGIEDEIDGAMKSVDQAVDDSAKQKPSES
jgi:sec-independent protein translocase protein TatA